MSYQTPGGNETTTHMAADYGSYRPVRNDATIVAPWPKPFDIKVDIFVPGKPSTFRQQVDAALDTRGLLEPLISAPQTAASIQAQ